MSRSDVRLGPSSLVILGILAVAGPATPYELKRAIGSSIGYFWPFPHAQLYAEAERLAALGLATETREEDGRRRRTYTITSAGRAAVEDWLRTPTPDAPQFRDIGLLKLAFGSLAGARAVEAIAADQAVAHATRLRAYEAYAAMPMEPHLRATLELGLRYERAALAFWQDLHIEPATTSPDDVAARPTSARSSRSRASAAVRSHPRGGADQGAR
jgi:DNA-binding PadR family transcriptional regulator